jgi:hypothetical protein
MPHDVPPTPAASVMVSPSMEMAAQQPPRPAKYPPTASMLEAPTAGKAIVDTAIVKKPLPSPDVDKPSSNKLLWIVFAVIALAMAGAAVWFLLVRGD